MKNYFFIFLLSIGLFACKGKQGSKKHNIDSAATAVQIKSLEKTFLLNKDSLNLVEASWLVKSVYDTVANEPQTDNKADTITRDDAVLKYHEDQSGKYYIYIVENRGPMYGASSGWCDVFILKRNKDGWKLNDFSLRASSGGMYGNPGSFEQLMKTGDESMGIVISGGQTHMGNNFNVTIINLYQGRLGKSLYLSTHHDYGEGAGDDYKLTVCDENEYHFKEVKGKKNYDLILERYNCLGDKSVKVDSAVVSYQDGYKIPARFLFEG